MIKSDDKDGDVQIDMTEFMAKGAAKSLAKKRVAKEQEQMTPHEEKVLTFKDYDHNGDGYISVSDMILTSTKEWGYTLTKEEAEKMIKSDDKDGDVQIDMTEFMA